MDNNEKSVNMKYNAKESNYNIAEFENEGGI